MAIDTIMLAFCEDCESHGGHPKHAPPLLLEAIGDMRAAQRVRNESLKVSRRSHSDATHLHASS
jgi:choline transporter-like protein 2/4/5